MSFPKEIKKRITKKLIESAVKDLRRWIFPFVCKENIFTDLTYSYFFDKILQKNKGINPKIDEVIDELLLELKKFEKD
jgi:hypothetical protein